MFAWSYYGAEVIQFKGPPPNGLVTISQQRITKIIYNQKFSDLWQVAVIDAGLTQAECGIEIDGENFLVPVSWADHFPSFQEQFGNDFSVALTKPTGKRDGTGNLMQVWQDYVAGTDPTDENDKFPVSITFNAGGKPQIAYSPKFDDETEAAKRKYTTYGKAKLNDNEWTEVAPGKETDYNFFKVTVEMQ